MPGDRAEDRIHNLFEADNSFQGHYLSQTVDDNWSLINYDERVEQQGQVGVSLNQNLKNNDGQRFDSIRGQSYQSLCVPFNNTELSQRSDCGFSLEGQKFAPRESHPQLLNENTLSNWHILSSKSSLVYQPLQEYEPLDSPTLTTTSERSEITETSSDFNFRSTYQQLVTPQTHAMQQSGYNDMQLLQQHMMLKQLQELQRQQQLGDMRQQQNSLNQFSAVTKQGGPQFSPLINGTPVHDGQQMFMNWGASPTAHGTSNRGVSNPQLDASFYGTPVGNARGNNMSQLQGMSNDAANLLTKVGSQTPKSSMQSSAISNPFTRDQSQGFQWKNMSSQVPFQGLNNGMMTNHNLQEGNQRMTTSLKDVNETAWPVMQQKTTQVGTPQGLVPLDPIEEKILYNMDDSNIWDSSFGRKSDLASSQLECSDLSNAFSSGSWSALMQSAVAETSSAETGMQEEWSGLTFQNMEQSTDNNQMSNFIDSDKKPTGWVDNNLQNASSFNSSFSGFQQPGFQPSVDQTEGLSHESLQKSPKDTGLWFDGNVEQRPPNEGSQQQSQSFINMDNAWTSQITGHSENDAQQQKATSFNYGESSLSRSTGVEQVHGTLHNIEDSQMKNSAGLQNFDAGKAHRAAGDYMEQDETNKAKESTGYNQHKINDGAHGFNNVYEGAQEVYENKHNLDKDSMSGFQGTSRELPYRGDGRSVGSDHSTIAAQTREKILEIFGQVDQPGEDGSVSHFGSSDSNMPRVDTHTSAAQLYNQSSASQGYNSGFTQPSQPLASPNQYLTSHGLPQTLGYQSARQVHSDLREKSQTWLAPTSSVQTSSPDLSKRATWDNNAAALGQAGVSSYMNQANSVTMGSPHAKNQSSVPAFASRFSPQEISTDQYPVFEATSASLPSFPSELPQQGGFSPNPQNVWVNAQNTQQHLSITGSPLQVPSNLASSVVPPNVDLPIPPNVAYQLSDVGAFSMNSLGFNAQQQGKVNSQQQISSQIPEGLHVEQQDLGKIIHNDSHLPALHHQNYSLGFSNQEREAPSTNSSLQNVASAGIGQNHLSQACGGDMVSGHNTEHGQVNLPMAPTWFKQYGTLKNGQMLPTYDARIAQFSLGKLSQNLSSQSSVDHGGVSHPSQLGTLVTSKQLSAPYVLPLDIMNQGDFVTRPKKRKTVTYELLPWHKEVSQACQKLQNISMAEQDWARASNRLVEKVDYYSGVLEDLPPLARSKRRIVLTTGLMQLLLNPSPAFISTNATSNCESLSYFVSRLVLGDACSLTYGTKNEFTLPLDGSKTVARGNQHISEIVEGLSTKAKELGIQFQRLDKSASILDIRVGCQELERFSVINRFAKFHSRGPADNNNPGTSSTGAPKPCPQRYVLASPMPKNLPDGLQCFSL
ncbi:hypothetical protein ACFE04_011047 [Oxalis oulophora]